ncbi:WYL domain-containing protein, partial [Patescibacteria group bacterium]|nr:WYL domain-containing protein [Patescibacteria group bacterium]
LSLNSLASATLGASKSSDGLQALQWYKEGKIELIKEYCLKDVQITKDLYEFGKKNGHLLFTSKFDAEHRAVAVDWARQSDEDIRGALDAAMKNRQCLEIEYVSREAGIGEPFKKTRKIDVYAIRANEISAFCHLRNDIRMFRIGRILRAKPVEEFFAPPAFLQPSLF